MRMVVMHCRPMCFTSRAASPSKLVGQTHAHNLAGVAATQQGLQVQAVQAVRMHGLRQSWSRDVAQSAVVVFGAGSV